MERDELRQLGIRQPIAVIPNGIELQENITPSRSQKGTKKALFVGRIHPKKGLPMLAEAWAATNPKGWTMHIVGPDEGQHRAEIEKQLERLGISEQWFFHGSIEGKQKWDWYSEADFTILPTYSENFGITVIESLAMGTPVITTTGTPWGRLLEKECGWWVAPTENALGVALLDATSIGPEILTNMGQHGATWISEEYTWRSITGKFLELYKWVLNQGNVPSFVDVVQ